MIVPDANLLLYANDSTSPFHEGARSWWESCLSGSEPVGLTHPVIFGFVRVGTSARAFEKPMSLLQASTRVASWLDRGITQVLEPDSQHVKRVLHLLAAAGSAGSNLVTDAQIASIVMAHRAILYTADRDFMRFPSMNCHYPLD